MTDQPTSSISTFMLKAAIIVPTPYMAVPIINVLFIPIISPSLPPVSVNAAITSEYNAIANWILAMLVFRSCTKAVIATFIIVVSITIMNSARLNSIRTPHLPGNPEFSLCSFTLPPAGIDTTEYGLFPILLIYPSITAE